MAATFGTSGTGNFVGQAAQRPQAMRDLLPLPPGGQWWYMHHPSRWQLIDGEWLPMLGQLVAEPGLNKVDKDGNTDLAEIAKRKSGWTIIPWEVEPGGYCVAWEGRAGPVHLSKWETPQMLAGQVRIKSDSAGYWAFCKRLLADGVIAIPDEAFIDALIERQAQRVDTLRTAAPTHPASALVLPAEEATLTAMTDAKVKLYATETPKRGRK